ncbi:MAG: hypothetical protein OEY96_05560 [Gammaproteobacteria bacterium]|nr:hypothetical protein [Gammaproteobacteria bacterium]
MDIKTAITQHLRQMALTPKQQIKQLLTGTLTSLAGVLLMLFTSELQNQWSFYLLSTLIVLGILYALPGYLGIWMWRMRKFFFDIDD